jgi:hypothetical protein
MQAYSDMNNSLLPKAGVLNVRLIDHSDICLRCKEALPKLEIDRHAAFISARHKPAGNMNHDAKVGTLWRSKDGRTFSLYRRRAAM